MKINILDSSIYNRISAGEVVENPASVVKELVENAVDAGANNITVRILDGGIKSIEVTDDGSGIPKEELYKTILPHATSKITVADDLYTISTLGFRGEALASISAVSDFEIRSRYFDSDCGAFLKFKNNVSETGDVAIERGTTIIVRNLFFNTPARYKFLNSKSSEESAVSKLIFKFILANPHIAVRYYADDKLIYSSSGTGIKDAVESVFPKNIADSFIAINASETDALRISGYITPADVFKNNKTMQTVILNGRIVSDTAITATVQNAYGTRLMARCFPVYVLNIVMPFDDVDVNVHPSKKEVRFANPRSVLGKIYNAVTRALDDYEYAKRQSIMADLSGETQEIAIKSTFSDSIGDSDSNNTEESTAPATAKPKIDYLAALELVRGKPTEPVLRENTRISQNASSPIPPISMPETAPKGVTTPSAFKKASTPNDTFKSEEYLLSQSITPHDAVIKPSYKVIGQVFSTYLLIECAEKLLVIDQHAMHERILYDRLTAELNKGEVPIQPLMIPYIYEASKETVAMLLKSAQDLHECGFDISPFGSDAIKIEGVPAILADKLDIFDCFNSICEELSRGAQKLSLSDIGKDKFATVACKAAIKGNTAFDAGQIELIMDFFTKGQLPLQCPHGRPTAIIYTKSEFEKLFRRKV